MIPLPRLADEYERVLEMLGPILALDQEGVGWPREGAEPPEFLEVRRRLHDTFPPLPAKVSICDCYGFSGPTPGKNHFLKSPHRHCAGLTGFGM